MPEVERPKPAYEQISDHLRAEILSGELSPGTKIPSARALATEWRVQVNTAMKALTVLRQEGFTEAVAGKGTFVRGLRRDLDFVDGRDEALRRIASARIVLESLADARFDTRDREAASRALELLAQAADELNPSA